MLEHTPMVVNLWVKHSIKNFKLIVFLILIEFGTIWVEKINALIRISNYLKGEGDKINSIQTSLNYVNPLYYIKLYKGTTSADCQNQGCLVPDWALILIFSCMFAFFVCFHLVAYLQFRNYLSNGVEKIGGSHGIVRFLISIVINFMDFCFKFLGLIFFYLIFERIIAGLYISSDIVMIIIDLGFLFLFSAFYLYQIFYVVLIFKLNIKESLHYDYFSQTYDFFLFIIKMTIAFNNNLILINTSFNFNQVIIILDILTIIFLFIYLNFIFSKLLKNKSFTLLANFYYNLIRISLIFYCSILTIVFTLVSVFYTVDLIISNLVTLIICAVCVFFLNNKIWTDVYDEKNKIYYLIYLMNLYFDTQYEKSGFEKEMLKFKYLHSFNCKLSLKKKPCQVCKFSNHNLVKDENKNLKFLNLLFETEEILKFKRSKEESEIFNFIYLILQQTTCLYKKEPSNMVVYNTKELMIKNRLKRTTYRFNLEYYYMKINKRNTENLKMFNILKSFDDILDSLCESIVILEDITLTVNCNIKRNLYKLTHELSNNMNKILENMTKINNSYLNYDRFSFAMSRFIFEKLFNVDMSNYINNLADLEKYGNRDDLLHEHYATDSYLTIIYNVEKESLIIKKGSKIFVDFQGKNLEMIFPKMFRYLGHKMMIENIAKNSESFKMNFIIEHAQDFIKEIKLDCKMFKSFDLQDIYIIATYEISIEDILIFESSTLIHEDNFEFNLKENKLVSFSENIEKILFLNPPMLISDSSSHAKKIKISFEDIFTPVHGINLISALKQATSEAYESYSLKYNIYFHTIYNVLVESYNALEISGHNKKLKDLKKLAKKCVSLQLKIMKKYSFPKNEEHEYVIYALCIENRKKSVTYNGNDFNFMNGFFSSLKHVKTEEGDNSENQRSSHLQEKNIVQIDDNFSAGSVSSTGSKSRYSMVHSFNGIKISSSALTSTKMSRFTLMTLIINILIMMYSGFFLIMGMMGNQKLKSLHDFKTAYNSFEHFFYQTSLSLFYNVGIYKMGTADDSDYTLNSYWNKFNYLNLQVDIGDYANSELSPKLDILKYKLTELQFFVYNSTYSSSLISIFNLNTKQALFNLDLMSVKLIPTDFFGSMNMFLNSGKSAKFYNTMTMIYIFNYNMQSGGYNFDTIWDRNISGVQKAIYETCMNYPKYIDNFNHIGNQINNLYTVEVTKIFNMNNKLSLFLILLHLILLFICLGVIIHLISTINKSNRTIAGLIVGEWTKYIMHKMDVLKRFTKFYKEDPIKLSRKFNKIVHDIKTYNLNKQNKSRNLSSYLTSSNSNKYKEDYIISEKDSRIRLRALIIPLFKLLFYIMSSYMVYAVSLIMLINSSHTNLVISNDYYSNHIEIDNTLMNYIMLLQISIFSNQTDANLANYLQANSRFNYTDSTEKGYVSRLIQRTNTLKFQLEASRVKYSFLNNIGVYSNKYSDCNFLYENIDDAVFNVLAKKYPQGELKRTITAICNSFSVMSRKKFDNIIEELNYITMKIVKEYDKNYGDYTAGKKINDQTQFFDMFTITVFILRPIQTFLVDTLLAQIITSTINNYLVTIISFLMCNILVEILIFLMVNRFLISKVIKINKEVNCLTKCLSS